MSRIVTTWGLLLVVGLGGVGSPAGQPDTGTVEIAVTDKATGRPVPCRVHLKDAAGKPQRAGKLPFWNDHFVCGGAVQTWSSHPSRGRSGRSATAGGRSGLPGRSRAPPRRS